MSQLIAEKNNIKLEIFPIGELGVNCTIIHSTSSKDAIIFDAGDDANTTLEYLKSKQLNLLMIIHTHAHFDHIGQSNLLKEKLNAKLCLNEKDMPLYANLENQTKMFGIEKRTIGEIDVIFNEGDKFEIPDSDLNEILKSFETIHTPGHSEGSTCFFTNFFETPVLIAGDTLFQGSIGRTDLPGGNYENIISSIKTKLLNLPEETVVITGHGPSTSIKNEKLFNPFVKDS